jgi:hypothetical protein
MRLGSRSGIVVWAIAAIIFAGAAVQTHALRLHLGRGTVISGWLLLSVMIGLALFNMRKKLSMVPLGRASTWLVLHVVGGILAVGLFLIHADTVWPTGSYERLLALLFYLVSLSGLLGYLAQRIYPQRLTQLDYEIIYERIPAEIALMRGEAEGIVLRCSAETGSDTIANHYLDALAWYFRRPRFAVSSLAGSTRAEHWLNQEFGSVARYLNQAEKAFLAQLRELCAVKVKIDRHYASQSLMKLWLLFHLPLVAALSVLALWHVLLVHIYAL